MNEDTISFLITYGSNDIVYNDVYLQHILADNSENDYVQYYNFNNISKTYTLKDNNDLFADNLICFANNGLELTGERTYTITKFINTDKLKNNFVYQINHDLYKDLKNITNPIINTIKGYYPLLKFNTEYDHIEYRDINEIYEFNNNTIPNFIDDLSVENFYDFTIVSPFDIKQHIILSSIKARTINEYVNICAPKTAALSLMGINNIMDIDTCVNNEEEIKYKSFSSILVKKGDKLYIHKDIKPYITYKLLSGNIRNIPSGNNVTFTIYDDAIIYTYNKQIYSTQLTYDYLLADEDTELSLYDETSLDNYEYSSTIKEMNINNFYKNPSNRQLSDLIIPVVPTINCNWKSNGLYFDHNSILNTDYQYYEYITNLKGHFTENLYMPGHKNDDQYINTTINDFIFFNNKNMSIRDFILNNKYKYPLKKFLIQNTNIQTAVGYYNKYIQTLEFIFYGIKFIINFNNNEYSRSIKLDEYNNYQIFILNDYDGSNTNEIFISKQEEFILIINHIFHINNTTTNDNVINTKETLTPVSYNWYNAPYNYDMSNCAKLDNMYIFKKSNNEILTDISYIIENDLNIYDANFNIVYNEQPYYGYIKVNDTFKSYKKNDTIEHVYNGVDLDTADPTIMTLMSTINTRKNYYNVSPLNDVYDDYDWKVDIIEYPSMDINGNTYIEYERVEHFTEISPQPVNNLYEFFNNYDINFRQKNTYILQKKQNDKVEYSYKDKISMYKESFENKNIDMYIINENGTYSKISINDEYQPINISLQTSYTKFNHGIFNPSFKKVFEFSTTDNISNIINMDCLLANTQVEKINSIQNYTCNKIVKTGNFVNTNYFILPTKEMFTSCWDGNLYRLYNNESNYDNINGYITGIEDKTLFGSKCLVIHNNEIVITKYDYDTENNIKQSVLISNYNENTVAQNTYNISINLTKIFYNNIINNENFYSNWTTNISDMSKSQQAMNNYILNTLMKFFNLSNNFTIQMYRKYDINKLDTDNVFIYDMPDDFQDYEEYNNFTTDYQISDNELNINITLSEYINYYYYLIIKINRY